jgi:putative FmdB family regulatory protein
MPTYEYKCKQCGKVFEIFHSMSKHPDIQCPSCSGSVERLIGAGAGIIIKGNSGSSAKPNTTRCGNDAPCCGRDVPCDSPACDS